jgi:hypothetical protein
LSAGLRLNGCASHRTAEQISNEPELTMDFRKLLQALMAGIVAMALVLVLAGWWMSSRMLSGTDLAYEQGFKFTQAVDVARSAQVNFQRQIQEWKNVLLRGGNTTLLDTHWKGFEAREVQMDKELDQLLVLLRDLKGMDDLEASVAKLRQNHGALGKRYRAALLKYTTLDTTAQQAIDTEVRGMDRATSTGIDALVSKLQAAIEARFKAEATQMRDTMRINLLIAAGIAALLVGLLLALVMKTARGVYTTLGADPEEAVAATVRISTGDLTQRLGAESPNSLMGALEMMQSRLRNISLAIREVAFEIDSRATTMPAGQIRDTLRSDVERLRSAIDRLQIERTEPPAQP